MAKTCGGTCSCQLGAPIRSRVPHLQPVLALVAVQYLVCVYAHCRLSVPFARALKLPPTVAEWIHRHQHVSDVCLDLRQLLCSVYLRASVWRGAVARRRTHVDFAILESLLQIVVDGLVRDLADQRKV
jgi:hypothetical protein